jgi:hypothetical protein
VAIPGKLVVIAGAWLGWGGPTPAHIAAKVGRLVSQPQPQEARRHSGHHDLMQVREGRARVLPDIQDEHGGDTEVKHAETDVSGAQGPGDGHAVGGMLAVTWRSRRMPPGWSW